MPIGAQSSPMMNNLARGARNIPGRKLCLRQKPHEAVSGFSDVFSSHKLSGRRSINSSSLTGCNVNWKRQRDDDKEENCRIPNTPLAMQTAVSISDNRYDLHLLQRRNYSVTTKSESATLVMGLGAIAATAKAAQYAVRAYEEYKANLPEEPGEKEQEKASSSSSSEQSQSSSSGAKSGAKRENIFSQFFDVGSKYYEGGFEDKMTRREAALILGVRESSTEKRIKEAHRKLLILNHPDTGGSTYLSGKVNEAKDLLLKAKGR